MSVYPPVLSTSCLQASNIHRLMKALRTIEAEPRRRKQTFLLEFYVLDGPFWCIQLRGVLLNSSTVHCIMTVSHLSLIGLHGSHRSSRHST